jgi:hypothetical protein
MTVIILSAIGHDLSNHLRRHRKRPSASNIQAKMQRGMRRRRRSRTIDEALEVLGANLESDNDDEQALGTARPFGKHESRQHPHASTIRHYVRQRPRALDIWRRPTISTIAIMMAKKIRASVEPSPPSGEMWNQRSMKSINHLIVSSPQRKAA